MTDQPQSQQRRHEWSAVKEAGLRELHHHSFQYHWAMAALAPLADEDVADFVAAKVAAAKTGLEKPSADA